MDFIVSYQLYKKMRNNKINELNEILNKGESEKKSQEIKSPKVNKSIFKTCERCGQDPYFCQCEENTKLRCFDFNPEKDNY